MQHRSQMYDRFRHIPLHPGRRRDHRSSTDPSDTAYPMGE
jgi:hypothetical protein